MHCAIKWIIPISFLAFPHFVVAQSNNMVGQIVAADIYDSELSANKGSLEGLRNSLDRNSIYFKPAPEPALDYFRTRPNIPDSISWHPVLAKIAKSNEWGFTTGPINWQNEGFGEKYGEYLTVWKRDRRGKWKIALKAEIEHPNPSKEESIKFVNPANEKYFKQQSDVRLDQREDIVRSTDRLMGTILMADNAVAYKEFLGENARMLFAGYAPQIGKENILNFLKTNKIEIKTENIEVDRSYSGELAYSYGSAKVIKNNRVENFYYIRIWELNEDFKWNVIVEMLFEK